MRERARAQQRRETHGANVRLMRRRLHGAARRDNRRIADLIRNLFRPAPRVFCRATRACLCVPRSIERVLCRARVGTNTKINKVETRVDRPDVISLSGRTFDRVLRFLRGTRIHLTFCTFAPFNADFRNARDWEREPPPPS